MTTSDTLSDEATPDTFALTDDTLEIELAVFLAEIKISPELESSLRGTIARALKRKKQATHNECTQNLGTIIAKLDVVLAKHGD